MEWMIVGSYTGIGTHFPRPITGGGNLGTGDSRYCKLILDYGDYTIEH